MSEPAHTAPIQNEIEMKQRVRQRVMRERRRRLIRNTIFVLIISGVMLYVALLQRDVQARRTWDAEGQKIAARLQAEFDRTGVPPLRFPDGPDDPDFPGNDAEYLSSRYFWNPLYPGRLQTYRPVGVAALNDLERMYLRDPGKIVILFDGDKYYGEWMPVHEFQARRQSLGF